MLRDRRLAGFKFRRQVPVGPYVLDFLCKDAKQIALAIEADGDQHADSSADVARTAWLTANGYRVLRFWNGEILSNPEGVYEAILAALRGECYEVSITLTLALSRKRERGQDRCIPLSPCGRGLG